MTGAKKDDSVTPPFQGRWTRIGTAIGDTIQRDILFAEKHFAAKIGRCPRFKFERNELGEPVFEDFAKVSRTVTHNGKVFTLFGTCDGIMRYASEDGEVLRVGLEIKSKQTTYAQTSEYSTRNGPKEDHVKQCVCYSIMYGTEAEPIDFYVILYVNASKKSWMMTPEEFAKNPDIAAFGLCITEEMRREVLDSFAEIVHAVETKTPPRLDIDRWTFNGFKCACALSLSDEEVAEIQRKVAAIQRSSLPDWKKREPAAALEFIERVRSEEQAKEAA
jgi:hypothetical protein